jgi:hypothetical protein
METGAVISSRYIAHSSNEIIKKRGKEGKLSVTHIQHYCDFH